MKLHCIAKHIGAFAFLIFILLVAGWIRIQGIPEIPEGQFTSSDAYFYYQQASGLSILKLRVCDLAIGRGNLAPTIKLP